MAEKKRSARGSGTIRQRKDGRWEARFVVGVDPGTGKDIRRSVYGSTQNEVRRKMTEAVASLDAGTYKAPCKLTVGQWLDTWATTYLVDVKPRSAKIYESDIRLHIKPHLGAVKLEALTPHMIQKFYNTLAKEGGKTPRRDSRGKLVKKDSKPIYDPAPLSAKTIKNIHGCLHRALKQATMNGYIRSNPADACSLPRSEKRELAPLDEAQIAAFLDAIAGDPFEELFTVALFTGMREGEIFGLTWDCVDFERNTILVSKQMQLHQEDGIDAYALVSTKNGKARKLTVAPTVMDTLRRRRVEQAQKFLRFGIPWKENGLVFTNEAGEHLTKPTVYRSFKRAVKSIGRPDARFHDLRHSYAVASIRSGDDIKTVQGNLGHATAAFTLDVYGHVTDDMKQDSAARMEQFIHNVRRKNA